MNLKSLYDLVFETIDVLRAVSVLMSQKLVFLKSICCTCINFRPTYVSRYYMCITTSYVFLSLQTKLNAVICEKGLDIGISVLNKYYKYLQRFTDFLLLFSVVLQLIYNKGVEKGYLPKVPGTTILLYCASTGLLFHAAVLEPQNLRPSYWTFLLRLSGGR